MKKLNILIINYEYPPTGGGAAKVTHYLANELVKQNNCNITLLFGTDAKYGDYPVIRNAKQYPIFFSRKSQHETGAIGMIKFLLKVSRILPKIIKEREIDLIHYFFSVPTGLCSFTHPKTPYIVAIRGGDAPGYNTDEFSFFHKILLPFNKRIVQKAKAVTTNSIILGEYSKNILDFKDYKVIRNGVDIPRVPKQDFSQKDEPLKLIMVSRFASWKRIDLLLEAVSENPNCTLTLIGEGSEKEKLEKLTIALNINDRVFFKGFIDNTKISDHLLNADAFVLPSPDEGSSNSMLEAMAHGLPILGINSGGTKELVTDKINGLLADPHDLVALSKNIKTFIQKRELLAEYGQKSYETTKEGFSWAKIATEYTELYKKILN